MTNPDDVKPAATKPKKTAPKKAAPTATTGASHAPKTTATPAKPAPNTAAKSAAGETSGKVPPAAANKSGSGKPATPKATPKTTPKKATSGATAKPVAPRSGAPGQIPLAITPAATPANTPAITPVGQGAIDIASQPTLSAPDRVDSPAAKILQSAAINRKKTGFVDKLREKMTIYSRLMRLDRPIGTLLLLWPTLWSLWIAAKGIPSSKNLVIFVLGVIVMRAAGCVINDFADRKIDGKVQRTKDRPLASGAASSREALGLFVILCVVAFVLVLFTDPLTIKLSVGGLLLAFCYPFMKRHTHLPQVVLGAAFAWGIPMAFAAEAGELQQGMWLIYLAVVLWTVAYDTFYAMVDRADDLKIGVKSTAILFGEQDRLITGVLQIMTLYALALVGNRFELGSFYYLGLAVAAGLFIYQQWLIRFRGRDACFKAFLNNNWVGVSVFAGIVVDYSLR